ncbi:MAG: hypothetical protein H6R03_458, partial [Burkholderiaceae bacterium]|nr:hypothetical protein [Burkholderiaceae bacterium]
MRVERPMRHLPNAITVLRAALIPLL